LTPHDEEIPIKHKGCENGASVSGTITRCEAPRVLAYTWGEASGAFSEVSFELTPVDGQVRLELTHRRLADRAEMIDVASGWHAHLGILAAKLDGAVPSPFWAHHTALEAAYDARLP